MPMLPPAPPRLSTTTCCPQTSVNFWPSRRAIVSVAAPGGNGTMMRIGRPGYCCSAACAVGSAQTDARAPTMILVTTFIFPPRCSRALCYVADSIGANAGFLRHFRVLREIGLENSRGLLRARSHDFCSERRHALLDVGQGERLQHFLVELHDDLARRLGGSHRAVPRTHRVSRNARFCNGRYLGQDGGALFGRDG